MLSVSPTCFLSEISRRLFSLERMLAILALLKLPGANPRDGANKPPLLSLMTTGCHCKGSEELDNLFR